MRLIYMDANSTCPVLPEVAEVMAEAAGYANPASQHAEGRRAHRALEDAREEIAELLGADLTGAAADRLIFTSGGTEANNLALNGDWRMGSGKCGMAVSAVEHPSVMSAAEAAKRHGCQIAKIRVGRTGAVDLDHLNDLLGPPQSAVPIPPSPLRLASVMLANNETGVLQPIAEIACRCAAAGVALHTDAVQAVGKIAVNFRELGVASMTVAPHKFGGPRGIGALLVRHDMQVTPILHGATQQFGLRPGTESVTLAVGFLAALRAWHRERLQRAERMAMLRERFESGLRELVGERALAINGSSAPRLPNTSNVAFLGHDRQALFMALDLAGVCCSTGSACQSGSSEPSPTLIAMGLEPEVVGSSLRFSIGPMTTVADIDEALDRLGRVLRGARPRVSVGV